VASCVWVLSNAMVFPTLAQKPMGQTVGMKILVCIFGSIVKQVELALCLATSKICKSRWSLKGGAVMLVRKEVADYSRVSDIVFNGIRRPLSQTESATAESLHRTNRGKIPAETTLACFHVIV
jgi:hypothetical protein